MSTATDRDERLAALIEQLAARQQRGEMPDIESVARANPELADELRSLWATAQFAAALARPLPSTIAQPVDQISHSALQTKSPSSIGDYEILEELGRGGMGVVYKARQKSLHRIVALKMMRDARLASEDDRARLRAEAEAVAKLKHPNIVTVHDVGEHDGQPYFVMEHVAGQTLARRIADGGPFPSREAARLIAEV